MKTNYILNNVTKYVHCMPMHTVFLNFLISSMYYVNVHTGEMVFLLHTHDAGINSKSTEFFVSEEG